ncbi:isochorismatase family protein [Azoarcus olearius]|uniref:isochorismatase family protein n=1 Tax=Azoarcus sp. (strain BH72) TaxID=418699 RepID=UPI0008063198|nr:isochorismatase family protein [Azoarcus olearius]ANQ86918.1 isochorismatase family protein [Azoarcus olearius]
MSAPTTRSALIIIDVQQSFPHAPYWREDDLPAFRNALLELEAGCRARGVPVVHIFHIAQGPFAADSGLIHALPWLPEPADAVFHKHTHNAFTDTGLDLWLRRRGIDHLIISGIRTEQCCETTARVGSDIGYRVDFVTAATLTFPMTHAGSGRTFSAEDIKTRTELVLAGRFARIAGVEEVLADLDAPRRQAA